MTPSEKIKEKCKSHSPTNEGEFCYIFTETELKDFIKNLLYERVSNEEKP